MTKIAIIRIAGQQGLNEKIKTTFKLLNLHKKNTCVLVPHTKQMQGMINVLKDNVTWGEIDKETLSGLLEKRGRIVGNKPLTKEYIKEKTKLEFDKFVDELLNDTKQIRDIELHRHNNQPITYGLKGDWMKTLRKVNEITSNELSKYEDGMIIDRRLHLLIERTEDQRKSLSNKASAGFA